MPATFFRRWTQLASSSPGIAANLPQRAFFCGVPEFCARVHVHLLAQGSDTPEDWVLGEVPLSEVLVRRSGAAKPSEAYIRHTELLG